MNRANRLPSRPKGEIRHFKKKTRPGASHKHNPPGTKLARRANKHISRRGVAGTMR